MNTLRIDDAFLEKVTRWSLYLFAAAMPFTIALTQIAVVVAAIAWLARLFYTRTIRCPRLGVEWGFMAFIAAELLACLFSTNLGQNLIYLKRLLLIPIVYIVAANSGGEKELRRLGLIFAGAIALYSAWGIGSFLVHPALRVRHIQNSMTAGGITMVGAVIAMVFALRVRTSWERLFMSAAALLSLACLLLTSTRGSWVGFFFATLVVLLLQQRRLLLILPVIALAFYLLSPANFSQRLRHIFDPAWGTNAKRMHWWAVGWEIYKDHPVVGIGDVGTTPMYTRYAAPGEKELIGHFHSNFVHIAVTLGAVGLTAFLFMMGSILVRLAQRFRVFANGHGWNSAWALAALAVFIAFNINGFFEWNFGDQEIITMIWFAAGVGLGLKQDG